MERFLKRSAEQTPSPQQNKKAKREQAGDRADPIQLETEETANASTSEAAKRTNATSLSKVELQSDFIKASVTETLRLPLDKLKTVSEFEAYFINIAQYLLNRVTLVVAREHRFRITEIEFYLKSTNHYDPFTHGQTVQVHCGKWYFHKTGNNYRGGTYKGLDITIGSGDGSRGGILIRSIEKIRPTANAADAEKMIHGPCNCVDEILKLCRAASIEDLVDMKMEGIIDVEPAVVEPTNGSESESESSSSSSDQKRELPWLYLEHTGVESMPQKQIYSSGRIGLNMRKKLGDFAAQEQFLLKRYRYYIHPKKIVKGKNHVILSLYHDGLNKSQIKRVVDIQESVLTKYITLREKGAKKTSADEYHECKLSTNQICELYGHLAHHL